MQPRHHQHVGSARSAGRTDTARGSTAPAPRPGSFRRRIRNPRLRPSRIGDRLAHRRWPGRARIAERRVRQQRHARLVSQPARRRGGADGDVGQSARPSGGNASACRRRRSCGRACPSISVRPNAMPPGARVDGVADVVQAHRGRARQPGHHRVGVAGRHHAGGEHVAVLVHHALAVAQQEALPLQPRVEEVDVFRGCRRDSRALWISMPVDDRQGRGWPCVACTRSSRPISTGVP